MEIRISVAKGDLADLESLDKWLRGEPQLAGQVRLTGRPPAKGTLGPLTDAVIAMVSSGGTLTVLAGALSMWLAHRPSLRIKVHRPDGTSVEIGMDNGTRRVDVEAMIRRAFDAVDPWPARNAAAGGTPAALDDGAAGTAAPEADATETGATAEHAVPGASAPGE